VALTTRITGKVGANQTGTTDLGVPAVDVLAQLDLLWTDGTAADQANRLWSDRRTVNASTTDSLDLSGTTLLDAFGIAVVFVKVKAVFLRNRSATQTLTVTRPAAGVAIFTAASDAVPVPPGGCFLLAGPGLAGLATVTATTADLIDVVNPAGGSAEYDVVVVGTSA
jgi:hypothetical protein